MNVKNENITAYILLVIYGLIGILLRYEIISPCDPALDTYTIAVSAHTKTWE